MADILGYLSDLTILVGAAVVLIVALVIFFRSLREGLWVATKRCANFLFETFP